jgi:hypothetical protein
MVESEPSIKTPKKGKPNRKVSFLKMKVMEDLTVGSINCKIKKAVDLTATALTDGYCGYSKLKEAMVGHKVVIAPDKTKSKKVFY